VFWFHMKTFPPPAPHESTFIYLFVKKPTIF
jgi:hypothetical protein